MYAYSFQYCLEEANTEKQEIDNDDAEMLMEKDFIELN